MKGERSSGMGTDCKGKWKMNVEGDRRRREMEQWQEDKWAVVVDQTEREKYMGY